MDPWVGEDGVVVAREEGVTSAVLEPAGGALSGLGHWVPLTGALTSLPDPELIAAYEAIGKAVGPFIAFELGTMFAPIEDRDAPGKGFTHKVGDVVTIAAPHGGAAIADAMRVEYQAIIDAGLLLQIDDPRLVSHYNHVPGVTILSDDRIAVRMKNGQPWLYGTPWHGDAGLASPASSPRAPLTRETVSPPAPAAESRETSRATACRWRSRMSCAASAETSAASRIAGTFPSRSRLLFSKRGWLSLRPPSSSWRAARWSRSRSTPGSTPPRTRRSPSSSAPDPRDREDHGQDLGGRRPAQHAHDPSHDASRFGV